MDWEKGGTYELSYEFDAPDKSPEFYLLGPLSVIQRDSASDSASFRVLFKEQRKWQIAVDAAPTHEQTVSGSSNTTDTVTSASINGGTDQLYLAGIAIYEELAAISSVSGGSGLTWVLQKRQCADRIDEPSVEVWQAFGSPGSSFTVTATSDTSPSRRLSIGVSRYSGVDKTTPTEGAAGENTAGPNGACDLTGTDNGAPELTLTSINPNSILYVASHIRNKDYDDSGAFIDSDYTRRIEIINSSGGDGANLYIIDRTLTTAGTDTMLNDLGGTRTTAWDNAGLVINGSGEPDIQLDADSTATRVSGGTTCTWNHTTGSGSDRAILMMAAFEDGTEPSVTYDGSSTGITTENYQSASFRQTVIFSLLNPGSGTKEIVITFTDTTSAVCGAVSFTGVNQTDCCDGGTGASGNTTNPTVDVTSESNDLVVDVFAWRENETLSPEAGQTQNYYLAGGEPSSGSSREAGASTVTMSWGTGAVAKQWGISAVNINVPEYTWIFWGLGPLLPLIGRMRKRR